MTVCQSNPTIADVFKTFHAKSYYVYDKLSEAQNIHTASIRPTKNYGTTLGLTYNVRYPESPGTKHTAISKPCSLLLARIS